MRAALLLAIVATSAINVSAIAPAHREPRNPQLHRIFRLGGGASQDASPSFPKRMLNHINTQAGLAAPLKNLRVLRMVLSDPKSVCILALGLLPILFLWSIDHPERLAAQSAGSLLPLHIHAALDVVGFFTHFGLMTILGLGSEIIMSVVHGREWAVHQPIVLLIVAYTAASHFNYLTHGIVAWFVPAKFPKFRDQVAAGIGGMLVGSDRTALRSVAFAEHKLMDAFGHLVGGLRSPHRADHWLMLLSHLCRYFGHPIAPLENTRVPLTYHSGKGLPVGDVIDCIAHTISAYMLLGPTSFGVAALLMEVLHTTLGHDIRFHHA